VVRNNTESKNSLTIDVEEYFQVEAFAKQIDISDWNSFESRIDFQMNILLDLFEEKNITATFFILGIIAKNNPTLINKIARYGHEIASHGFNHQHITKQNRKEFKDDLIRAKSTLEDITSQKVMGYRAPCFSITPCNDWAHDEILSTGHLYSSSTYPISHDFYGVPLAPRTPYILKNGLLEIPVSTVSFRNKIFPSGGGGYFRLIPYFIYNKMLKQSAKELSFVNFYTHPWEYDPEQPKIKSSFKSNFRHRINQHSALKKLSKLCDEYEFDTLANNHLNEEYLQLGSWTDVAQGKF
jgi:polysaccharide deacetylase family protein (PEP-CTERM system associated)